MIDDFDYEHAAHVYYETFRELGYEPSYPSESSSYLSNGVWYLRNSNGHLAKVGTQCKSVINPPPQV